MAGSIKEGPKFKKINWTLFAKLCGHQATKEEIASVMNLSQDTIDRAVKREHGVSYKEFFEACRVKGQYSLRSKQYHVAMKGNVPMLIHLGKQYLKQSDKSENKLEGSVSLENLVMGSVEKNSEGK